MDEATSAVDPDTDSSIQTALRSGCIQSGTTILTIAHRLQTIVDYDKILVMSNGNVLEYDTPPALLGNSASQFYKMYNNIHDNSELDIDI